MLSLKMMKARSRVALFASAKPDGGFHYIPRSVAPLSLDDLARSHHAQRDASVTPFRFTPV